MKRILAVGFVIASMSSTPSLLLAQAVGQSKSIASSSVLSQIPMLSFSEGGKSNLVFRSTPIAAMAEGKAQVQYRKGNAEISAKVSGLPKPATLGPYTTYILWAVTPDGRAVNEGVLTGYSGGKGSLDTKYSASQFALIVTAEPHFAVSMPSNKVVLYNVASKLKGEESKVAKLAERADYSNLAPLPSEDKANPPAILQARYAVEIAKAAGAQQFAPNAYAAATDKLAAAESAMSGNKKSRKGAADLAREATLAGEDARRAALSGSATAAAEAERAAAVSAAAAAERQKAEAESAAAAAKAAREDLRKRLNTVLPTRESDRGLVSEIGGVQFQTGSASLSSAARQDLSRFAGIVASYADLKFNIEGHTDNTGSATVNRELSLRRAMAVRDYLVGQGVPNSAIEVAGLGPSRPVADNATAQGRARNRRVEIVVSGGPLETEPPEGGGGSAGPSGAR